jgi:phage terminase large subunit-like protein
VYVLNVVRDRLDPAGVQNLVMLTADQDGFDTIIAMEEEKGASGKSNSTIFAKKLMGYRFTPEPVSGKKDVRAAGYAAHQGNGLVYLVA